MKARLTHKTSTMRFYKLSKPIKTGISFCRKFDIIRNVKSWIDIRVKPEYRDQLTTQFPEEGVTLIAVSDALKHSERLVFPAFVINGEYHAITLNIDGRHTLMIEGGNPRHVHPDEVYMRHLCMINGLKWEGFESEE